MKQIFALFALLLITLASAAQSRWSEVRIHADQAGMLRLAASGLAIDDGFHAKDGTWTTVLSQQDLATVRSMGFAVDMIREDYSGDIARRNRANAGLTDRINHDKDSFSSTDFGNYPVPQHFRLGSMGGFLTPAEVESQLDSMRLLYPNLISEKLAAGTGTSIEGRSIWYVMISNNPNQVTTKPKVFYNSLTHAREPMGMQQLFYFMWYLLENYGTSPEVTYLVDNLQIFVIPVMNPDGYQYNFTSSPWGGGGWRKNRRISGGGNIGVDLNRNYGYKWGYDNVGSSPDPSQDTYRGTGPFSEPETQTIREFCTEHHFALVQNYHTYSDYTLWPWCYVTSDTPDSLLQNAYARFITRENGYLAGHPGAILYNTNGDALDWQYGEQTEKPKALGFCSEIGTQGDGFWPVSSRIITLCQENMYSNLIVAHQALRYAEVHDASPVILSSRQGRFGFQLVRYGMDPCPYTVTLRPVDTTQFISWGGPKSFNATQQLTPYADSVDYLLVPSVTSGDAIRLVYEIDCGLYTFRDTVVKYYGPPLVVFSDSCNTMANWISEKWGITTSKYHSPPSCITDSPAGNYGNNANVTVASTPVDLKGSPVAVISFWTRYRTELGYDYAQFRLQGGAGPWMAQKGLYTKTSFYQEVSNQPVYDGNQPGWVREQIVTTDFANRNMNMQFLLKSDMGTNYDGFSFDDVTVTVVDMTQVGLRPGLSAIPALEGPVPNPASGTAALRFVPAPGISTEHAELLVTDARGGVVARIPAEGPTLVIPVNDMPAGVYFCRINGTFGTTEVKKLVVIH